jgi:hypothetical protein
VSVLTAFNGRLPESALTVADSGPNGPQRLRLDAAASRRRMIRDGCPAGHLRSGYRDLAAQALEVARARAGLTPSAALPGTSGHGEGIDTDDDPPARAWITTHGDPYGWVSGLIPAESWHHEYFPARDQHAHVPSPASVPPIPAPSSSPLDPTTEDPDMRDIITACYRHLIGREPSPAEVDARLVELAGVAPVSVRTWFLASRAEPDTVKKAFADFMGHAPNEAQIAEWTAGHSVESARAGIWGSDEAAARR